MMAVNFSTLVLRPCMSTFAPNMVLDPVSSRPGEAPLDMRGIYTTADFDVLTQEGGVARDRKTTIGIRIEEFTSHPTRPGPPPAPRDGIIFKGARYFVDDITDDGQGGMALHIRLVGPDFPT